MTNQHELMAHAFDQYLLTIVKEQRKTVVDDNGNEAQVPLTAADLNVIRQRLKDCGITSLATPTSPIANIVAEMKKRQLSIDPNDANEPAFGT